MKKSVRKELTKCERTYYLRNIIFVAYTFSSNISRRRQNQY